MSNFKKGDRVRVTFEGEVAVAQSAIDGAIVVRTNVGPMPNTWVRPEFVEKIEPPVEPFGAGDFVREVPTDRIFYVAENGYAQVKPTAGQFWAFGEAGVDGSLPSTTGEYEKVEYAQVPF